MKQYLVIDIGGTAIKFAMMDSEANIISKGETPTLKTDMDAFLGALDSVIAPRLNEIEGIAISMPGKIDIHKGIAFTGGALSFIKDTPIKDILEAKYNVKVAVENDGKAAALAEAWKGSLSDVDNGAVIILGTGIGGGIILERKLWRGMLGSAGEFSNIVTDYSDVNAGGTWASINGYGGLTKPYAARIGVDRHEVDGRKFFEALHNGDENAQVVFTQFVKSLAAGIVNIQSILDVDKYCIGGGISAQDILIETLRVEVSKYFEHNPLTPLNPPMIDRCAFKNDANLIGALSNYFTLYGK